MLHFIQAVAETNTVTIILTIVGTVGAGGLVKLVQSFLQYKKDKNEKKHITNEDVRDVLQKRVGDLEGKIEGLQTRIEDMIKMYSERILELSTHNTKLSGDLDGANKEIERLIEDLENQ